MPPQPVASGLPPRRLRVARSERARAGKLKLENLAKHAKGKVVSERKRTFALAQYKEPDSGLRLWNEAGCVALDAREAARVAAAREEAAFDAGGFARDGYDEDMEYMPNYDEEDMEYMPNYDEGGYASGYDDFPPSRRSPPRSQRRSKRSTKGIPRARLDL